MQESGLSQRAAEETEELFAACRDSLVRYLRYHGNDHQEAEDIAQESFIRYFEARIGKEKILQPRAWLFRVAHNLMIDRGRKKRPDLLDEQGWIRAEGRMATLPSQTDERIYISQLPWHELSPMELGCMRLRTEGLKLREIGEVLELSISSVVSYLARATKKLGKIESADDNPSKHGRTAAPV